MPICGNRQRLRTLRLCVVLAAPFGTGRPAPLPILAVSAGIAAGRRLAGLPASGGLESGKLGGVLGMTFRLTVYMFQHVAQPAHRHDAYITARQFFSQSMQHHFDGVKTGVAVLTKHLIE